MMMVPRLQSESQPAAMSSWPRLRNMRASVTERTLPPLHMVRHLMTISKTGTGGPTSTLAEDALQCARAQLRTTCTAGHSESRDQNLADLGFMVSNDLGAIARLSPTVGIVKLTRDVAIRP